MSDDALEQQLAAARAETEAVRQKLHNAVRKGKAIQAEKEKKEAEVAALAERVAALEAAVESRCGDFWRRSRCAQKDRAAATPAAERQCSAGKKVQIVQTAAACKSSKRQSV